MMMKPVSLIQTSGPLFEAVQQSRIFGDSKHFVDCVPNKDSESIMKAWKSERESESFNLKVFVERHFDPPAHSGDAAGLEEHADCNDHIKALWPMLFRKADNVQSKHDSLLPLPHPYVVPGGRFREIYYWDSYFTSLGLAAHGHEEMVLNMTRNFAHLIQTLGHIPNGNRTYYVSRSQPPFFPLMVNLCAELFGDDVLAEFVPAVIKEHRFWMDETGEPDRRSTTLEDGSRLNRHWDDNPAPREESWIEDVEPASPLSEEAKKQFYRNIRAACESGWDFSSRWLADEQHLQTIETTRILPVDLNALLWYAEKKLSEWLPAVSAGGNKEGARFHKLAENRKNAMHRLMWNSKTGFFHDYHIDKYQPTGVLSLAGVVPLFTGLADERQAADTAVLLKSAFLQAGGLTTTLRETGQQWDAPNGWAPHQWMAAEGLRRYGHTELADEITDRWLRANENVFRESGKMVEKYNVSDISGKAGGGEYPLQDGFGWSNGVYAAMKSGS